MWPGRSKRASKNKREDKPAFDADDAGEAKPPKSKSKSRRDKPLTPEQKAKLVTDKTALPADLARGFLAQAPGAFFDALARRWHFVRHYLGTLEGCPDQGCRLAVKNLESMGWLGKGVKLEPKGSNLDEVQPPSQEPDS